MKTPGILNPLLFSSEEELKVKLKEQGEARGWTPMISDDELLQSDSLDDILTHYGVKGMRWGVRNETRTQGVSRKTDKEAKKDAEEYARAKMFYGSGAGTRRKLIKNTVEAKSKKDPNYKKAFDNHLVNQDMSRHAEKARSERKRKDVASGTAKTARGIKNVAMGNPQVASTTAIAVVAAYGGAKRAGIDKVIVSTAKTKYADVKRAQQSRADLKLIKDVMARSK